MSFRSWLEADMALPQGVAADVAQVKQDAGVKGTKNKVPTSPMSPRGLGVPLEPPKPGFSGGGKWKLPDSSPLSLGTKYKQPDHSPFSANNKWKLRGAGIMGK
ncbi:MAG: hypothetical protein M0R80_01995 [Proteobacteria bacterium]|jgi:hypothetical protein|nr:hypothetical protein [Pseudomonadota bacterium]